MNWYAKSTPNEIQPVPWLGQPVIDYLESILKPDYDVIEHGSGGSTLWFAERVKRVVAFEDNQDWLNEIRSKHIHNISIYNADLYLIARQGLEHSFDMLLIDGEPVESRIQWINDASFLVKENGWIILDNANRPEYELERKMLLNTLELEQTFNCNENTKYLVTDFYRNVKIV